MKTVHRCSIALALLFALSQLAPAEEPAGSGKPEESKPVATKADDKKADETTDEKKADAPATLTVKTEPLKIEVSVDGVFEAKNTTEVLLRPKAWAELTVHSAVEHGRRVKKGQTLIKLNTQKIDLAIADQERTVASSQLALRQAELSLKLAKKSVPESLAAAKRAAKAAEEDFEKYTKVDRAESLKDIAYSVESAQNALSYQREELNQLEKMYKADDLTEETEEIILTRARNRVKAYERMLGKTLLERDQFLKYSLPRQDAAVKYQTAMAEITFEQSKSALPDSLTEKTMALEKLKSSHEQLKEKLAQMRSDRELMTVRAPADGIVYYGKASRGKWGEVSAISGMLKEGGAVKANMVLVTIVDDSELAVRTTVEEKDLHQISLGAKATITPTAFPDERLEGKLSELSAVPIADGKFDAAIDVNGGRRPKRLRAGMNCKAALVAYENKEAILVPKTAVQKDDGSKSGSVYVLTDKGQKKRKVKIGRTEGDRFEITKGLAVGDKVLIANPDNPKSPAASTTAAATDAK
jgi:RND family efflux transporter MFP subunit